MPYVQQTDRTSLDDMLNYLVKAARIVKCETDVPRLNHPIDSLADEINAMRQLLNNQEVVFVGLLNYCIHDILLHLMPEIRYWVIALNAGWLKRTAHRFEAHSPDAVFVLYEHERILNCFSAEFTWKHVAEYISIHLACKVAPNQSRDTQDLIAGVFYNIHDELADRLWRPYEDKQKLKNGDLPKYLDWITQIKQK